MRYPDHRWEELFAEMGCDRDRALLEFYVSSGARAGELLGIGLEDIDWPGQLVYVVSKGTRERQPVPASPDAFRYLGRYLAADGLPAPGQPVWRTRRGTQRPLTYWAMRRILQRANDKLGTNWTLSRDKELSLSDVQWVMGHAHLSTTEIYLTPTRDEVIEGVLAHHARQSRVQEAPPPGYDPQSLSLLFGRPS